MPEREVRPRLAPAGVRTPVPLPRQLAISTSDYDLQPSPEADAALLLAGCTERDKPHDTKGRLLSHSIALSIQHRIGQSLTPRLDRSSERGKGDTYRGFDTVTTRVHTIIPPQTHDTTTPTPNHDHDASTTTRPSSPSPRATHQPPRHTM